jgi:hypothetical protein
MQNWRNLYSQNFLPKIKFGGTVVSHVFWRINKLRQRSSWLCSEQSLFDKINEYSYNKKPFQFYKHVPSHKEHFLSPFLVSFIPFLLAVSFIFLFFSLLVCLHLVPLLSSLRTCHILFQSFKLLFWKQFRSSGYVMTCLETWQNHQKQSWYHCSRFAYSNQVLFMVSLRMLLQGDIKRRESLSAVALTQPLPLYSHAHENRKCFLSTKNMLSCQVITCCISVSPQEFYIVYHFWGKRSEL